MNTSGASAGDAACRNCGAVPVAQTPPPRFCARCGQETTLHPPTFGEFVHELVGHYVALEGPMWRTLVLLVARPGRLTREYLAGRRRRYVLPLRLYLSASFLFFVALKLVPAAGHDAAVSEIRPAAVAAGKAAASAASPHARSNAASALPAQHISDCGAPGKAPCTAIERWADRVVQQSRPDPVAFVDHLRARALALAPYAVFLLLPVFAALVRLAYRARGMTYGEHFVFSLHLHAFWFLALLAIALLPTDAGELVQLAMPVYGLMALHEVYGGRWGATLARAAFVSVLYAVTLIVGTVGLFAVMLLPA
jgi:hypothetical protein